MARLFVSLYLLIAIGIVGLSAILEQVFFDNPAHSFEDNHNLIAVIEKIAQSQSTPRLWLNQAGIPTTTVDINAVGWQEQEKRQLEQGKVLNLYDPQLGQQLFALTPDGELLEISIGHSGSEPSNFLLYSSVFFILLAGLLAIWVWPLWCDLNKVQGAADKLQPDGSMEQINIPNSSLIKPIADALNRMSQQVRQLLAAQRELTGAVAHEFRTPLSRLKFALAMKSTPDSEGWRAMNKDIDELEKLVQEMLSYTSMEVQLPEMNMSRIPLASLCHHLTEKLDPQTRKDLTISVHGQDIFVLADSHYLERAIENLLLNACRYAKTAIDVNLIQDQHHVFIYVDDDGEGLDITLWERIFDPFFRPDDSRNRKHGGAGLGLAIVKRIMQWHGGQCWVESAPKGGARFALKFDLPDSESTG